VIELVVNGKRVELEAPTPLLGYLEKLGVNPRTVAVEHNGEIVERSSFASITLREGDKVEIVRMVGGGWLIPSPRSGETVSVRGKGSS
jgi:thiamine biosynthesis protein ThiS